MPKGYSLHIGLNEVNPKCYDNWSGSLNFAEEDALAMLKIARSQKYTDSQILMTATATRKKVLSEIGRLAKKARSGDSVLITYSGHGSVLPNLRGRAGELNETWCCYNGMLVDKELLHLWHQFKAGVRIVLVSDSCHSGDIARVGEDVEAKALARGAKFLPAFKSLEILNKKNQLAAYEKAMAAIPIIDAATLSVRVKQIGGCAADSFSYEGAGNGELTLAIKAAFDNGAFKGDYAAFFSTILTKMTTDLQTPVLLDIGAKDDSFDAASPFTVEPSKVVQTFVNTNTVNSDLRLLVEMETPQGKTPPSVKSAICSRSYNIPNRSIAVYTPKTKVRQHPWDAAHQLYDELKSKNQPVRFVEPEMNMDTAIDEAHKHGRKSQAESRFLASWPYPEDRSFNPMWHFGDKFSQLAAARDSLMNDFNVMAYLAEKPIRIAHIDTGFFPDENFMPTKLQIGLCKSFVEGEEENLGFDHHINGSWPEQQGHGAATLAILAGPKVNSPKGLEGYTGYIGAIPFAEVISIRIQDMVALLKTSAFERAVYYAVEQGCEVITMSMAGAPSRRWAEAVNYAYEKGVTIVSAAGNSWRAGFKKILPPHLLFPARFERVIGATGVTHSQQPYVFDANDWEKRVKTAGGINMQGNFGPEKQMHHIMAAYTPNVCWAETGEEDEKGNKIKPPKPHFVMTGGGTSSATPQIAAAAALWIVKHRKTLADMDYTGTWRQVEAVRTALFESAQHHHPDFKTYNGRGALRALDSFKVAPHEADKLTKSKEAKTPFFPLIQTFFGWINDRPDTSKQEMLALELGQLVVTEPALKDFCGLDFTADTFTELSDEQNRALKAFIAQSPNVSNALKTAFGS